MKHLVCIKTSSWPWSFHLRKMNQPTSSISASSSLLQNCRCAVDNSLAPSLYPPPHLQFFRLIKNDRSEEGGHSKTKPIFGKDQTRIFDFDAFRQYRNQLYLKQHFNFCFQLWIFLKEKSCFKEPTNTQIKTM